MNSFASWLTPSLMSVALPWQSLLFRSYIYATPLRQPPTPPGTSSLLQPALQSPQVFYWLVCFLPTGIHHKCREKAVFLIKYVSEGVSTLCWSWGWCFSAHSLILLSSSFSFLSVCICSFTRLPHHLASLQATTMWQIPKYLKENKERCINSSVW